MPLKSRQKGWLDMPDWVIQTRLDTPSAIFVIDAARSSGYETDEDEWGNLIIKGMPLEEIESGVGWMNQHLTGEGGLRYTIK
jgi:hypothetical protein